MCSSAPTATPTTSGPACAAAWCRCAPFVAATAPLGHNVLPKVLPGRHAVSESGRVIVYYRLDRDGRFVIGGHGNLFNVDTSGDDSHVRSVAEQLYPELSGVEWEYHWAGWPAMTRTHLPMLVGLAPGAYAGLGYNGRGVATATMMGKQLALAVLGETPALRVEPLSTFALHPLRQIGISYRLIVGSWLDRRPRRKAALRGFLVSPRSVCGVPPQRRLATLWCAIQSASSSNPSPGSGRCPHHAFSVGTRIAAQGEVLPLYRHEVLVEVAVSDREHHVQVGGVEQSVAGGSRSRSSDRSPRRVSRASSIR